jgi:hypothetical protein
LIAGHTGQALALSNRIREGLTLFFVQEGFVVEGFQLRGPARHEQVDDSFCCRCMVGWIENASGFDARPWDVGVNGGWLIAEGIVSENRPISSDEIGQRDSPKSQTRAHEPLASHDSGMRGIGVKLGIHWEQTFHSMLDRVDSLAFHYELIEAH